MIKRRDPLFVIFFTIITLGIYGIYWFYKTSKELIEYTKRDSSALLWTLGLFIPIVNVVIAWKYAHTLEKATKGKRSGILIFLLWLVFFPAAQYVVQSDINKLITA
jgi:hypothetical protein